MIKLLFKHKLIELAIDALFKNLLANFTGNVRNNIAKGQYYSEFEIKEEFIKSGRTYYTKYYDCVVISNVNDWVIFKTDWESNEEYFIKNGEMSATYMGHNPELTIGVHVSDIVTLQINES